MKKSQLTVWTILILTLSFTTNSSYGSPAGRAAAQNSTTTPTNNYESDGIFLPYQGERFSVFDWNLCKKMANKYQGNFLISPLSAKLALVLLYEGAQDQTALELAEVMRLPDGRWATRDKFAVILRSLKPVFNEYELDIGTRMFIDKGVDLKQSYRAIVKAYYDTDVQVTNFSNTHDTAMLMNNWVNNVTHGNIKKIIDDEDSIRDSVMVVMNSLYFKGSWHTNSFSINDTRIGKFYKKPGMAVNVPYMSTVGNFYFSESIELDAKILRIPYVGNKFAMYIILPRTVGGLDQLLKNINPFILTRHVWLMQDLPLEVRIPKFKFDFTSHLEPTLREMGIRDVFDNTATLNGIARAKRTSQKLVVSDIVQKAGIEVTEKGTTAYATTEIQLGNKIGDEEFVADHPFLFYIEDEITGTILYMGRVSNPLERGGSTDSALTPVFPTRFNEGESVPITPAPPAGTGNEERHNYFNVELLQEVNEQSDGNVIVAPLSVKAALMALLEGTGGRTRDELLATLRLPSDVASIRGVARQSLSPFQDSESGTEISLATRLWVGRRTQVSLDYSKILQRYYSGDIKAVNFEDPTSAAAVINEWVRYATKNNIKSIVEPGALSSDTHLLLTSALYFRGRWLNAFDENATRRRSFQVPNLGCQEVDMMENTFQYKHAQIDALAAEVVEIPYADRKLSMLVFLPNSAGIQSLQTLSRDLSYTPISVILGSLQETELLLQLPRFSIENKHELRSSLENMGVKDLFDLSANLSGILPTTTARIGNVFHNAKIEVNEVGTVAAAVTGLTIIPLMGSTAQTFRVDRPFLFAIVDRPSKAIIFAGRVIQPGSQPPSSVYCL